jgi:hypothetical protein
VPTSLHLVTISAAHDVKLAMEAHYGWLDPWNLNLWNVKKDCTYCTIKVGKDTENQVNCCIVACQIFKNLLALCNLYSCSKMWNFCRTFEEIRFKGTVQRELRWVKIGINRTAMKICIAGNCHLPCPKGHHHERSLNILGGCSTFWRHPNRLGQYTQQRRTNSVTASVLRRCSCAASDYPKMLR